MFSFRVLTLGCKANQYDSAALAEALNRRGGKLLEDTAGSASGGDNIPNLVLIITCCVTSTAMQKSRQAIRRAVRQAPDAVFLVAGCYGDYDRGRITELLEDQGLSADRYVIAGHHDDLSEAVYKVVDLVGRRGRGFPVRRSVVHEAGGDPVEPTHSDKLSLRDRRIEAVNRDAPGASNLPPISNFPSHQRAFVKIQDGCDAFCAYCVVPYTRPRVRSRSVEQVVEECRNLVSAGHKEIVLSGVFLGAYGRETCIRRKWGQGKSLLPELLGRLGQIEGLWKVRLSSLEPLDADDELLSAASSMPNFAPHFHLPLQSGSEKILKRMNRQYTPDEFRGAIERIRGLFDRPSFTTDIIVGFPGEGDEDFAQTLDLARWSGFSKIHAFAFSAIEGTAAWLYRQDAPAPAVVRWRMAELSTLERDLARSYRSQFVGETIEALVESPSHGSKVKQAMTDRYLTVRFTGAASPGQIVRLRIEGVDEEGLTGRLEAAPKGQTSSSPGRAQRCPG